MATSSRGLARKEPPQMISRLTKTGRKLTYALTVIQQPARARACGSGAKSSADRRPVDPPPVVELRVFEEKPGQERQDITFAYTANFFLFATLENSRPMAHGRLQQPPTPSVPVLTGMPVSGMAYLDRPEEAGYFIFPDLSVRHEGTYKLSFNLYEETKDEDDRDADTLELKPSVSTPDASFDWRLEIKSDDFVVYSAKKFPGLAESTSLSRTVAEQGCRVRIRRDVRMRRREEKPSSFEEPSEEEYHRSRALERERERERSRSLSDSPEHRIPYDPRQGNHGYNGSPSSWGPGTPHAPHSGSQGYLAFTPQDTQQYQPPPQPQFAPPQPPSSNYPPSEGARSYASYVPPYRQPPPPPPPPPSQQPSSSRYGEREPSYPRSAYPSIPPRERPLEVERDDYNRRASMPYPPPPQHPHYNPPPMEPGYPSRSYDYTQRSEKSGLAPLKLALEPRVDSASSPPGPLPPIISSMRPSYDPSPKPYSRPFERPLYPETLQMSPLQESSRKRSLETAFPLWHADAQSERLYDHKRPNPHSRTGGFEEDDQESGASVIKMTYKRADGSEQNRPWIE